MCDSLSGSVWILEYCELTVTFDHENLTLHLRVQVIFFAMFKYLKNGTNGHLKTRQLWAQLFLTSGHKNTGIGGFCLVWHFFLLYEDFRIKAQNIETEQRVKKQSETKDFFHINKSLKTKRSPPGTAEPFTTTPLKEEERSPTPSFYMVWRVLASSALPLFPLLLFGWLAPGLESCRATVPKTTARVLLFIPPPPPASPLCSTITTTCYFN